MSGLRFPSLGLVCVVTLSAGIARAQDASSQPAPSSATEPAPRKVWTNEDVPTLREDSTISTVGSTSGARPASAGTHPNTPGRQDAKWYVDQITKLQAQLPPINQKIAQLEAGIEGKFTGDAQTSTRPKSVTGGSWQQELAQLTKQRDDLEARISTLRDQARHQGIPPNALP
jgi:cell division protein FtsB